MVIGRGEIKKRQEVERYKVAGRVEGILRQEDGLKDAATGGGNGKW